MITNHIISILVAITFIATLFLIISNLIKKNKSKENNAYLNKAKYIPVSHEKRRYERVNTILNIKIKLSQHEIINAETKDISITGAFIISKLKLNINEKIKVNLYKKNYKENNWLDAKVIWSNTHLPEKNIILPGFGIKFINIHEKEKSVLNEIMDKAY